MDRMIDLLKEPVRWEFDGSEKEFENNVVMHIEEICQFLNLPKIESVHRQRQIKLDDFQVIFDIVVKHIDSTATIFEVKKANNKHPSTGTFNQMQGVGQLLLYQNVFELVTGGKPRLVLIDNKIYERTIWAFVNNKLPITLVDFQKDRIFIPYRAW
ncbi:hypothetical protein [Solibacillus sp. FSL K6-1523]|uniref:hypothetical protein n=1 Tax=Solibacillus sp. FSL K6-1523 TaxID=2921471 RepID=UPI0030F4DFE2